MRRIKTKDTFSDTSSFDNLSGVTPALISTLRYSKEELDQRRKESFEVYVRTNGHRSAFLLAAEFEVLFGARAPVVLPLVFIRPDSPKKIGWDFCMLIIIFYICFTVPIQVFYQPLNAVSSQAELYEEIFFCIMFSVDIVLSFFTGYYEDKIHLITDRFRIARRYVRGLFILDVIATIPWHRFTGISQKTYVIRILRASRLMRTLRLLRVLRFRQLLEKNFQSTRVELFVRVFTLVLVLMFMSHFIACAWLSTTRLACTSTSVVAAETCWAQHGITGSPNVEQESFVNETAYMWYMYSKSFFWAMLTLTIGMPGSPYPMNYIERLIAIFVAWSSVLLIGVLVTNICEVLDPPPPTEFQLTVARVRGFLNNPTASQSTTEAVRKRVNALLEMIDNYPPLSSELEFLQSVDPGSSRDVAMDVHFPCVNAVNIR
jgi:hypothetical protein